MLKKLEIKDVATYDESGIVVENLNKVNFIYGANGSGKTTISKFIGNSSKDEYKKCQIEWTNNIEIKALVYNKEFRDENFGGSDIAGIFTLGQATNEEIEKIQEKNSKLTETKNKTMEKKKTIEKQKETLQTEEENFKELVWKEIYKKNENMFKEAFKGVLNKEAFKNKILNVYKSLMGTISTKEELEEKSKTIFGEPPKKIDVITEMQYDSIKTIEEDDIWSTKVVGKQDINISKLIQKLNNGDWVNTGRKYIQESDVCPFCQQHTITADLKKYLCEFFDEEFERQMGTLNYEKKQYSSLSSELLQRLQALFDKEKSMKSQSKLEVDKLEIYINSLIAQLKSNKEVIEKKCKEPSINVDIVNLESIIESINRLIRNANNKICENNNIVDNYNSEKGKLIDNIWNYLVTENKVIINTYQKKKTGLNKGILALEAEYIRLQTEQRTLGEQIKRDSKNVTSVQPSVDEINRMLKFYGFVNFMIVPSTTTANYYQIQRQDGSLAEATLSEGEITFITFLYFLQLAKGSMNDQQVTEDRILVVDDPISSLDSSVLFIVSSLLKEIIIDIQNNKGPIKQIIILTHNVYFHKEISFFGNGTDKRKDTYYWILRKIGNITNVEYYERENPISSSYELLWKELKESNKNSGITIQNIMRRILENYFKILGKFKDDDLISKFKDVESQRICRSLLCWINDGSHCMPDDLFVECAMDTIDKYNDVFSSIFDNMGQIEHYNMMMGVKI